MMPALALPLIGDACLAVALSLDAVRSWAASTMTWALLVLVVALVCMLPRGGHRRA